MYVCTYQRKKNTRTEQATNAITHIQRRNDRSGEFRTTYQSVRPTTVQRRNNNEVQVAIVPRQSRRARLGPVSAYLDACRTLARDLPLLPPTTVWEWASKAGILQRHSTSYLLLFGGTCHYHHGCLCPFDTPLCMGLLFLYKKMGCISTTNFEKDGRVLKKEKKMQSVKLRTVSFFMCAYSVVIQLESGIFLSTFVPAFLWISACVTLQQHCSLLYLCDLLYFALSYTPTRSNYSGGALRKIRWRSRV